MFDGVMRGYRRFRRATAPIASAMGDVLAQGISVRLSQRRLERDTARAQRILAAARRKHGVELPLHLGCGAKIMEGWLNVDVAGRADLLWDLSHGLPFVGDDTVPFIYHEHFLEHLSRPAGERVLRECRRTLVQGGVLRIAVPDLESSIRWYRDGVADVQKAFADEVTPMFGELLHTRGELLNIAMRAWGHQYLYNEEDLRALLQRAGFDDVAIVRVAHSHSSHASLRGVESRTPEQSSLIVEATKGGRHR